MKKLLTGPYNLQSNQMIENKVHWQNIQQERAITQISIRRRPESTRIQKEESWIIGTMALQKWISF